MDSTVITEQKILLNGEEISSDKLDEMKKQKDIRLFQEKPGVYRVLQRLSE